MAKGRKTGGRQKGSPNKTTATVKAALTEAFERNGGVASLLKWAQENETEFYKLWSKMIPAEVEMSGKGGGPLSVTVRFAREGRRVTAG